MFVVYYRVNIDNIKLKKLDEWNSCRRQAARWYQERLGRNEKIILPHVPDGRNHVYHLYVIRVPERDRILKELGAHSISAGLHYPVPLHLQTAYNGFGYQKGDLPVTESVANSILSLPMFPHITEDMVDYVCGKLNALVNTSNS